MYVSSLNNYSSKLYFGNNIPNNKSNSENSTQRRHSHSYENVPEVRIQKRMSDDRSLSQGTTREIKNYQSTEHTSHYSPRRNQGDFFELKSQFVQSDITSRTNAKAKKHKSHTTKSNNTIIGSSIGLGVLTLILLLSGSLKDKTVDKPIIYPTVAPTAVVTPMPEQVIVNPYLSSDALDPVINYYENLHPEYVQKYANTNYYGFRDTFEAAVSGDIKDTEENLESLKIYCAAQIMKSYIPNLNKSEAAFKQLGYLDTDKFLSDEIRDMCFEYTGGKIDPEFVFALMNQLSRAIYNQDTESTSSAGLMSISSIAEKDLNNRFNRENPLNRFNPIDNIALGIQDMAYLYKNLSDKYSGDDLIRHIVYGYKQGLSVGKGDDVSDPIKRAAELVLYSYKAMALSNLLN